MHVRLIPFGVVFTLTGLLLCATGLRFFMRHRRYLDALESTSGEVVEVLTEEVDNQTMYRPVVEFRCQKGAIHRATHETHFGHIRWNVGDTHIVRYDRDNPSTTLLGTHSGLLFGAELFGIMGVVFLPVGVIALLLAILGPDSAFSRFIRSLM